MHMNDIIPNSMVSINIIAINNTWSDILYSPMIYRGVLSTQQPWLNEVCRSKRILKK